MKVDIDYETAEHVTKALLVDTYKDLKQYLKRNTDHPDDLEMFKKVTKAIEVLGDWYFVEGEFKKAVKK